MTNLARFRIEDSPSSDRGYAVTAGATLEFALEASASVVRTVSFHVRPASPSSSSPRASSGAAVLTLDNGSTTGQAVAAGTPTAPVYCGGFPGSNATAHTWEIVCLVNGGFNDAGVEDPDYRFSRFIALRNDRGLRKILMGERDEFDPSLSWAAAFNELVDAAPASGGGGVTIYHPVTLFAQDWYEPNQTTSPPAANAAGLTIDAVDTDFAVRAFLSGIYGAQTEVSVPVGVTSLTLTLCARLTSAETLDTRTLIWSLGSRAIGGAWSSGVASRMLTNMVAFGTSVFTTTIECTVEALGIAAGTSGIVELYRSGTSTRTANLYWTRWDWS